MSFLLHWPGLWRPVCRPWVPRSVQPPAPRAFRSGSGTAPAVGELQQAGKIGIQTWDDWRMQMHLLFWLFIEYTLLLMKVSGPVPAHFRNMWFWSLPDEKNGKKDELICYSTYTNNIVWRKVYITSEWKRMILVKSYKCVR